MIPCAPVLNTGFYKWTQKHYSKPILQGHLQDHLNSLQGFFPILLKSTKKTHKKLRADRQDEHLA